MDTSDSKRTVGLGIVILALVGCAVWFSWRRAESQTGEARLDLSLICAACGYTYTVDYEGLLKVGAEAQAKGLKTTGGGGRAAPLGFCPKCNKPELYRAEEDAETGKPVLPAGVQRAPAALTPGHERSGR